MNKEKIIQKVNEIKKKANLLLLKINKARKINKTEIQSYDKSIDKLINENNKIIIEQIELIDELVRLNNELKDNTLMTKIDFDTYFTLTINNEVDFDVNHPFYKDIRFIKALIDYYIEIEEYEKCIPLQKLI